MNQKQQEALSLSEQKNIILNILADFCSDADTLVDYLNHVGFDLCSICEAREIPAAFLGHYRIKNGVYDLDRACNHLATWPPIAARIEALRCERDGL